MFQLIKKMEESPKGPDHQKKQSSLRVPEGHGGHRNNFAYKHFVLFKVMATNREKGVVFIGLGRKPEFYQHIAKEEFKDSKNIELRALGRAIPRALKIAEKLTSFNIAQYTRLISEPITIEGKESVLVIIKLKYVGENREKSKANAQKNTDKRDRDPKEKDTRSKQPEEKTQKPKRKYVEKEAEKEKQTQK